jgi:hypothetical protein
MDPLAGKVLPVLEQRFRSGRRVGAIFEEFAPLERDFTTIFHPSHVDLAKREYAEQTRLNASDYVEQGFGDTQRALAPMPPMARWVCPISPSHEPGPPYNGRVLRSVGGQSSQAGREDGVDRLLPRERPVDVDGRLQ